MSQRDILYNVLTTTLSILVSGHDTADEEDEDTVDEELDDVSPYSSAAKVGLLYPQCRTLTITVEHSPSL